MCLWEGIFDGTFDTEELSVANIGLANNVYPEIDAINKVLLGDDIKGQLGKVSGYLNKEKYYLGLILEEHNGVTVLGDRCKDYYDDDVFGEENDAGEPPEVIGSWWYYPNGPYIYYAAKENEQGKDREIAINIYEHIRAYVFLDSMYLKDPNSPGSGCIGFIDQLRLEVT